MWPVIGVFDEIMALAIKANIRFASTLSSPFSTKELSLILGCMFLELSI
jgi:hypothetical protein